jgi:hypothetical protein
MENVMVNWKQYDDRKTAACKRETSWRMENFVVNTKQCGDM